MQKHSTSNRCWRFSPEQIENSPSRSCGIGELQEQQLRRAGCAQIVDMATRLFGEVKMRGPATTACILFSRFYARHSFSRVDRWSVASSCLFLASKIEEMHRKLKDIVVAEYASQHEGAKVRFSPAPMWLHLDSTFLSILHLVLRRISRVQSTLLGAKLFVIPSE